LAENFLFLKLQNKKIDLKKGSYSRGNLQSSPTGGFITAGWLVS
jgi:hypothetical protein